MNNDRKSIIINTCLVKPTGKMVVYNYTPFTFLTRETFILLVNSFCLLAHSQINKLTYYFYK